MSKLSIQTLCLFVVLVVVGAALRYQLQAQYQYYEPLPDSFWVEKVNAKSIYDMVIIGNSRIYRGVAPEEIEQILPHIKVLNLGFSSGGLNPEMYQYASQGLSSQSTQPIIVLGVSPTALTLSSADNAHYHSIENMDQDISLDELVQSIPLSFDPIQIADLKRIIDPESNLKNGFYYQNPRSGGWVASDREPDFLDYTIDVYRTIFEENDISDQLIQDMLEQTASWTEQGILVYAFRPPAAPEIVEIEDTYSSFDEVAIQQQLEDAGAVWIHFDPENYDYYDGNHLHMDSARRLSKELAEFIKQDLDSRRNN